MEGLNGNLYGPCILEHQRLFLLVGRTIKGTNVANNHSLSGHSLPALNFNRPLYYNVYVLP